MKDTLGVDIYDKLWESADDIMEHVACLDEIYDDVPEHLKGILVEEMTIHIYPRDRIKEVLEFLNKD